MADYKKMVVWQKSMELVIEMYKFTRELPRNEAYSLVSQMTRAAISIPSNIAEGQRRGTVKEFQRFLSIAYGSGAELETQIEIIKGVYIDKAAHITKVEGLLNESMKLLNVMIKNPQVPFTD